MIAMGIKHNINLHVLLSWQFPDGPTLLGVDVANRKMMKFISFKYMYFLLKGIHIVDSNIDNELHEAKKK